eukprot:GHVR01015543.1.p1 GENE.GHVR01015543.1~~GHVR01015543.1.p1  ORF type:complete len:444 (-),score=96.84 GHVR01015543.1:496-1827(-)
MTGDPTGTPEEAYMSETRKSSCCRDTLTQGSEDVTSSRRQSFECNEDGYVDLTQYPVVRPSMDISAVEGMFENDDESGYEFEVTSLSFNQDHSFLAVGTNCGFIIYSCSPPPFQKLREERCGFAVGIAEMWFVSSLVALVPSPTKPSRPTSDVLPPLTSLITDASSSRQIIFWNCTNREEVCRVDFEYVVQGVAMNPKRLIVLLFHRVAVYDLLTMKPLHSIERSSEGLCDIRLCALCVSTHRGFIAIPGSVCVPSAGVVTLMDVYTLHPVGSVIAHRNSVAALAFNQCGSLLACAFNKSPLVRVFSVPSLERIYQFRIGLREVIFSLSFSCDSSLLVASTSQGCVHLFNINPHTQLDTHTHIYDTSSTYNENYRSHTHTHTHTHGSRCIYISYCNGSIHPIDYSCLTCNKSLKISSWVYVPKWTRGSKESAEIHSIRVCSYC